MEKTLRLSADQRDDLVAYLDGELPDQVAQAIDQVLARSEVARHEVEALARTWEMLDALPTPTASEEFTEKTMSMLKVGEVPFDITEQPWFGILKKLAVAAVWLAALGASGWMGFQITARWIPNEHSQMLDDLPVLQRLDDYQEIQTFDFLEQLNRSGTFDMSSEKG
jgi:anti-sigma factor RsiW